MDKISQMRLRHCYPEFGDRLLSVIEIFNSEFKNKIRILETIRSIKRQKKLYKLGESADQPLMSYHNYGLAANLVIDGKDFANKTDSIFFEKRLDEICKDHGLVFFMHTNGTVHIEMRARAIKNLKSIYNRDGLHGVWESLDVLFKNPYGKGWIGDYKFYRCIELEGL